MSARVSTPAQPIGRSVDETLRLVQAIQFHAKYGEVGGWVVEGWGGETRGWF